MRMDFRDSPEEAEFRAGLRSWLEANIPDTSGKDTVLCWGDSRIGNVMYKDFEPVGVLDWEMAALGPREMDISWMMFAHMVFESITEVFGFPGMPDFLAEDGVKATYQELTGVELDDESLPWIPAVDSALLGNQPGQHDLPFRRRKRVPLQQPVEHGFELGLGRRLPVDRAQHRPDTSDAGATGPCSADERVLDAIERRRAVHQRVLDATLQRHLAQDGPEVDIVEIAERNFVHREDVVSGNDLTGEHASDRAGDVCVEDDDDWEPARDRVRQPLCDCIRERLHPLVRGLHPPLEGQRDGRFALLHIQPLQG